MMHFAALESVDSLMMVGMAVAVLLMIGASALSSWIGGRKAIRARGVESRDDGVLHAADGETSPPHADWQSLADDPDAKIQAIKAYRELHGCGLAEAKKAVEAYIAGRGESLPG